jgi:23S rRNA G2069 N7-methylase RlmK/C1962 C5-methylase RlmI
MGKNVSAPAVGLPTLKISRRGAGRLQAGHVWVYRSDILAVDRIPPGALVNVTDERGRFLGTAFYSSSSQIAIRMLLTEAVNDLSGLLRERIQAAIIYRERIVENTDAYRVVFSEADFLPGLIVDRYNDLLSLQVLTQALDAESVRNVVLSELSERLKPAAIIERAGAASRPILRRDSRRKEHHCLFHEWRPGSLRRDGRAKNRSVPGPAGKLRSGGEVRAGRSSGRLLLPGRVWASSGSTLLKSRGCG